MPAPSAAAIARAIGFGERIVRTIGALGEIDSADLPGSSIPELSRPSNWAPLASKLKNAGRAFFYRQSGGSFARQGPMASVGRAPPSEVHRRYSSRRGRSSAYGAALGSGTLGGTSARHAS